MNNYNRHLIHLDEEMLLSFITRLETRGFTVQTGELKYFDILKLCSEGVIDNCVAQNAKAAYGACILPPAPNQEQITKHHHHQDYQYLYPPNIDYVAPGYTYKLRSDEAVVFIGKTPPPAKYFAFRSYLGFVRNLKGKDYSNAIAAGEFGTVTAGDEKTGQYHMVGADLGDQLNNLNIWTEHTPNGLPGYPFKSSSIIISTADQQINYIIREALNASGYSSKMMNNDNIPAELVNMGLEKGKDTFMFVMRVAIWENEEEGEKYLNNLSKYWHVLRITPNRPIDNKYPWPIPHLKFQETCPTEFNILPNARNELNYLRREIIKRYEDEYDYVELSTYRWETAGYEAIVQDINVVLNNRDALFLRTNSFQLTSDDDFVIMYGVNHVHTGKALYFSSIFYGQELLNGVTGITSEQCKDSVEKFMPQKFDNSKFYYVNKLARKGDGDCVGIIPYSTGNPQGKAFGVDNYEEAFVGFRIYVDRKTLVGPSPFDVIWDKAIVFTKKRN